MAVTNTGIVERVITGVNDSDLWLDSEATSVVSNTGAVERSITGVHDANFVRPLGDEEVTNGSFDTDTNWTKGAGWSISDGKAVFDNSSQSYLIQGGVFNLTSTYKITFTVSNMVSGFIQFPSAFYSNPLTITSDGDYAFETQVTNTSLFVLGGGGANFSIDNVSIKELLVTRESTATNTGIVERPITGVNESDLWLDAESTSVVNNTGIVERPIVGVNESDEMFPDNGTSSVVNIAEVIIPLLNSLEARATTFENREATQEILINLQKC